MRTRLWMAFIFFVLPASIWARVFEIDKDHTNVGFKVRHILANVNGKFKEFSGICETDEKGALIKVEARVKADSIDTNNKNRDEHLRSDDFFDTKKFPSLSFVSDKFKVKPGTSGKLPGTLTIHGVSKPVEFEIEYFGEAMGPGGGTKLGGSATLTIKRSDYGLTWNKALETGGVLVGDDVTILLDVEGNLKEGVPSPSPTKPKVSANPTSVIKKK